MGDFDDILGPDKENEFDDILDDFDDNDPNEKENKQKSSNKKLIKIYEKMYEDAQKKRSEDAYNSGGDRPLWKEYRAKEIKLKEKFVVEDK